MSYVIHGRQERKTTGTENKRLAEKIYGKTLTDIEEGRFFDRPKSIKMVEVIEKYMSEVSPFKRGVTSHIILTTNSYNHLTLSQ